MPQLKNESSALPVHSLTYEQCREYLDGVIRTGIKYDLHNIRRLLELLDHPERSYPVVCIAGTNGKGSVAAFLESILAEAGYRAGLNTSPHLVSPRERLRIDRRISTKDEFAQAVAVVREAALKGWSEEDPARPTFFETMTAAALHYFREMKVDIALMEAGLGGRLDGTNGTQPILTIITRIGLDHPKTLGNTLRKIAFEKFGLARPGKPLLIGIQRRHVQQHLIDLARFRGALQFTTSQTRWRKRNNSLDLTTQIAAYNGIVLGLPGRYQRENAATAVRAAELLQGNGFGIDSDAVQRGLAKAYWPARLELKEGERRILIDGSHNVDGIRNLVREIKKIPARRRILIYGKVGERSARSTGAKLLPLVDRVFLPPIPVGRATDPGELARELHGLHPAMEICTSIDDAWERARAAYKKGDLIIVAGSLYLAGHFKMITRDGLDSSSD